MTDKRDGYLLLRELKMLAQPNVLRSTSQLISALTIFVISVMTTQIFESLWVWSLCWLVALVMLMRLVIIQHDCGHYSLYRSRRVNDWIGYLISPLTTIPFGYWRLSHNIHHSNQSNLDARSDTEYPTLTTDEYQRLSPREQRRYQLTRSALGVCFIIPILLLVGVYRVPNRVAREARLTRSMLLLDVALISLWTSSSFGISFAFGIWLISMQA